jgi:SOS-response transcriptional repressor LexA
MELEIRDGDAVIGNIAAGPRRGRPAIVYVRGYVPVLKLWYPEGPDVRLVSLNPACRPYCVRRAAVKWAGRVLAVMPATAADALDVGAQTDRADRP